jgi:hypothetical protein
LNIGIIMKKETNLIPIPPLGRLLCEDCSSFCPKCGSSMKGKRLGFFGNKKCIHPQCGYMPP